MDSHEFYRPLLDLIARGEGTDRGRGYDETLAYGLLTGGPVALTRMTLDEVDALQTRMLRHPRNRWHSSACGRYQIVRTTLRDLRRRLGLAGTQKFDAALQDRLACYLLDRRGIDRYLAGTISDSQLMDALALEWASLPRSGGGSAHAGQRAAVSPGEMRTVLAAMRARTGSAQARAASPWQGLLAILRRFLPAWPGWSRP